ncbi:MAG: PKD domain-containing protein [Bacteroidota bacterium]
MKKLLQIFFLCVFSSIASDVFSTHLVGSTLTYVHTGGSNYSVKLVMYRDCAAGNSGFAATETITIAGYDGSPSKNLVLNPLGADNTLLPILPPCAVAPNPVPCVQQRIYTGTVTLPPNPGGYHLYWQSAGRNFTITNIVNTCVSCINSCLYTYIPGYSVIWGESFILPIGTTNDPAPAPTAWSRVVLASTTPVAPAPVANVQSASIVANAPSNLFRVTGSNNGIATWTSQIIPISSCPSVNLSVDLSQTGTLVAADSILVYYKLNGGPLTLFTSGAKSGTFTPITVSKLGIAGTNVQIIIRVHFALVADVTKVYQFDNVLVSCNDFVTNSNPVFTLLPPILVCAGQPFTFDHSAIDANGDSLVYSLYTPYDANNAGVAGGAPVPGGGAKKPTFPGGNTISFTPITWQPGYSATNPLGGTPLSLNPSTGLLSGTPPMLGQFLVGVMVKEYRNGVYLGQTIRDFQFNIVNCPPPPPPYAGTNIAVDQSCNRNLSATGYIASSVNWTSVNPGALGAYNSFLSCTSGCIDPAATGTPGAPPYVDYRICGMSNACVSVFVCDTIRVFFNPTLGVTIAPQVPVICNGQNNVTITANGSGGTPPYNYLWNNVNPSQSILVGNGTYTVKLMDVTGCPSATATVTVTSYTVNVSANAGIDKTVCKQNPITTLNGTVAGANGGIWSQGAGTFSPNNTTLSATYSPSPAELTAGFVDLRLTTTGSGACPATFDIVRINYINFSGTVSFTQTPVSCFGGTDGSATVSIVGGMSPYTYSWNTSPAQSTPTATNLALGTYSVTITNSMGCTSTNPVSITQPTPLALGSTITHVLCSGGNNGSISINPTGGTGPYTYLWSNGSTASQISNLTAQNFTVTVKDSKNCPITSTYTITQPNVIAILLTPTHVSCFNGTNGTANSTVSGGTSPYTYNWSSGATSPNASGLQAGLITLTVTDVLGCFKSNSVTITQPTAITASTTKTNETCSNLNNGSATAVVSGGTPGYTFFWQPGALTTGSISNLPSGNYTLTAKDLNGCPATSFALITEPAPLTINFISQVNVSCFGGNNGSVIASPAGGTIGYTYLWSTGATTSQISTLSSQTYSVTVTDSKLCTATNSVFITQPAILTASTTKTDETCASLNNGTATAIPAGGTPGYTYLWQPNLQTTVSASNLSAGTHSVTVTDSKGCTAVANAIIAEPPVLATSFTAQTNVSCFAGSNGAVTASPAGGTPGYTYLWTPGGATTAATSNLLAGTYSVTVTDSKGCFLTSSVIITQPTPLTPSTKVTNETCNPLNDGTATAIPSGGTPGYTYLWQPGSLTTISISNLSSGTYTLTVTDSKACTAIANPVITEPAPLTIAFNPQVNVTCFGGNDGSVTASPSGGTPNYTYLWASGGGTSASRTNLIAGTYTVTVTDKKGCFNTNSVVIAEPTQVVASTTVTNETCNYSNNGTATAGSTGGTPGYTYFWKPGLETTGTISNLSSGTYTLTATDSKGCTGTANAIIVEPAAIVITFTAQTNVSCFGGSDGTVTASPSGGTLTYTYLWAPGGATSATVTNLPAGKYSVIVTDNAGCTATKIVTITEPALLEVKTTVTNETCTALNNGTATAAASGGTSGYTYLWSNGGTNSLITSLSAQTYTVTITDSKGCTAIANPIITEPALLVVSFSGQINVNCFAGNDGSVTADPSGGTANYTFSWMPGAATTNVISNLTAGTYTVTVTDSKGCVGTNSVVITQPTPVVASPTTTNETCNYLNNGTATAGSSGGTPGYTYLWKPDLQTSGTITNLSAGTYILIVTDSKGCTGTANAIIAEPSLLAINFTAQTNVSCFAGNDGAVTASPSGGTPGYSYLWAPGGTTSATKTNLSAGTYTVTVTDNSGCTATNSVTITQPFVLAATTTVTNETCSPLNDGSATAVISGGTPGYTYLWSNGGTSSLISALSAQIYTLTVTDSKGCTSAASATITEPAPLAVSFTSQTNVSCFAGNDGIIAANPSGGTPNYTYLWAPGGATASSKINLTSGTYSVTITDSKGCIVTSSATITQPLAPLAVSASSVPATCYGSLNGSVSSSASNGTGPYTYAWMPGTLAGQNISNLAAGTYSVTATDLKGCMTTNSVIIGQPPQIILTSSSVNSDCGQPNGQSSVTVSGGSAPYTYLWSPAGGTNATAAGLSAGGYTVLVTDFTGCTSTQFGNVNENAAPVASIFSVVNVTCNGGTTGSAHVGTTGGIGPFTFSWLPAGGTDSIATGLTAGSYTVTVTGANGCKSLATTSPDITEPPPILITVTKTMVSCFGGSDGTASAIASGGTPGFTYQWLPGGTVATNLSATTYTVQVTDNNSCVQTMPVTITQPPAALSVPLSFTPVSCFGGANGSVSAVASGGTAPYSYNWMPGNINGQNISNLTAGSYTVTVTDLKGCTFIDNITVTQPAVVILTPSSINSNCSLPNGQASVAASGGTGGYLYQWAPSGGTNNIATALLAGTYSVTVTDGNGCISTSGTIVNDNPSPIATVTSTTNVTCNTGSNGTATASVVGGTGPFLYSWLPSGGTNSVATGLAIGTYTVTVTDVNLCQSIPAASPQIIQPAPIFINVTKSVVTCFGSNNGTASAAVSGGTPGYSYLWLPGGTNGLSVINLSPTTYTLQVTDTNACVQTMPFTITQPTAALSAPLSFIPVSCFGGTNGSVSAVAAGGTAPYNYNWMPGNLNGPTISNLTAGTYTVTVTDLKGCSFINSITVTQPTLIAITTDSINSDCSQANGQASVSASGGTISYLYQWAPSGGTNNIATALPAGTYSVTVTDGNGCISSKGVTVNDNASPVATVSSTTNISCNTGTNGTATVSVSGGTGPFTYSWMPGGNTNTIATGLLPGTYTITVTDANLCQALPAVSPAITQPAPIFISISKSTVSCFGGSNGTASAIASGGTAGYLYQWLPSGTLGTSLVNLSATTYSVTVTDANSCVKTEPFTITQPLAALSASLSFAPSNCFGGSDGSVSAAGTGGTSPYNYNWMPGNLNGPILSNLSSGTYTLTITDLNGCTYIDSITVTQPTLVILSTDSINSNCNLANGQASITATGGAGGFLYQWLPSGGTNAAATALLAGTYSVTVTDGNGCISTDSTTVNNNGGPGAVVSSTTNVSCNAGSNGTATVSVSGGTGPFTYSWMPSGNTDSIATGLIAGTYTVTVTDANLCQSLPVISAEITQPNPILITVTKTSVTCFGDNDGTASAIASGGAPAYSYQWLPGGTMGTNLTNLAGATYSIQVTDFNNCVQTLPVIITEPGQLNVVISPLTNVSCFGLSDGTATATVSGGTFGYTYNWLPSGGNGLVGTGFSVGTYTVTVTDINGCNTSNSAVITQPGQALSATNTVSNVTCFGASNGTAGIHPAGGTSAYSYQWNPSVSVSDTASGLAPGDYTVLVTDNNSCQTNLAISVTEPSEIGGSLVSINPSCGLSNGSISSQLSGGVLPYTYLWSFGAATTSSISGLGTGVYNLLITDASNCTKSLSVTLTLTPDPAIAVTSINNVSCFGGNDGSATINITQGTAPFAINWTPSGGNGLTASVLSIGTYTINVTDALGCQTIDSLIIGEPTPVDVSISSITDVLCNGGSTGAISVAATGGTGPLYTYLWTPGGSTLSTATNLAIGTYTVNVMDQNNCFKAISASVAEPTLLSSAIDTLIHATCYNGTGSASVIASGGVLPYSYSWSAPAVGQTGSEVNNLVAGSYTVTITDTNGCVTSNTLVVKQPLQVITTAGANDTLCLGQTGSISATAIGGAGNYYYAWQPSGAITAGTLPITPTSNTTYTVVAFDQIGCAGRPDTVTAIVYNLTAANVQAMGITPICPGQGSSVYVETTGITGPLTYQWNNNLGTGTGIYSITPAQPTTYIVTVSNMCGLSVSDSVVVLFNPQPTMALSSASNALCVPGYMPFFDNSVAGNPNDPITGWLWNFGDGTFLAEANPDHNYAQPGNYIVTLTVTTEGGCTSNSLGAPIAIAAHPIPNAAFSVNSTNLDLPFDVLILNNQSVGANSYYWEFGDGATSTQFNPQYLYSTVSNFHVQLIAMSQYGCVDTAFAEITTNADVIFPNAFTPNPNGSQGGIYDINNLSNDIFFPYSSGVVEFKIEIFNRWGEEIFESLDIKQGWDGYYLGAICQQDVYIYKAYVKLNNGKVVYKNGDVTILRY